ncbi:MAG: flagellar basal body-associated FliL family protein [Nitrospinae bacterium]|nr:flagellar basal body-associated FliL family protein [Nitrospinota bacterium]
MAAEDAHDDAEGGNEGDKPKKSKPKVLILVIVGVVVLALVAGGSFFAASMMGGKKKDAKESKEEPKEEKKEEKKAEGGEGGKEGKNGNFVSLEPIIVNLSAEEGKRYLKITMQLELTRPEGVAEVNEKMPQIKDAVITVLSSKSAEEVLTVDGKFKLKEQLMTRVNSTLANSAVKNVFFVEFVIQ